MHEFTLKIVFFNMALKLHTSGIMVNIIMCCIVNGGDYCIVLEKFCGLYLVWYG